jgi:hypothetical protein
MRRLGFGTIAIAALAAIPAQGYEIVGLSTAGALVRFDQATPGTVTTTPVTGLGGTQTLVAIDVRPSTSELYGLAVDGDTLQLYTIGPETGAAVAASPAVPLGMGRTIAGATTFEMEWNAIEDKLQVVTDLPNDNPGPNLSSFSLTDAAVVGNDFDLSYGGVSGPGEGPIAGLADTDPVPVDGEPSVASYPYVFIAGSDRFARLGPFLPDWPYPYVTFAFAPLGVDFSSRAGFDAIGSPPEAYAILETGGVTSFYSMDLATGTVAAVGTVGDGTTPMRGMAIRHPQPELVFTDATFDVAEESTAAVFTVSCLYCESRGAVAEFRTENGTARGGVDYLPASGTLTFLPGDTSQSIEVYVVDDTMPRGARSFRMRLEDPQDGAAIGEPSASEATIRDDDGVALALSQILVKPAAQAKLSANGVFALPDAPSEDPTTEGGQLTLDGASGYVTYVLDAANWRNLGAKGLRYKDAACKVSITAKQISAACKGATGTLALPETGPVSAVLSLGDLRYCGECGGTAAGNPAKLYKRKACAAPVACPVP